MASIFGAFGYSPVFMYIAGCWVVVAATMAVFGPRTGMEKLERLNYAGAEMPLAAQPAAGASSAA